MKLTPHPPGLIVRRACDRFCRRARLSRSAAAGSGQRLLGLSGEHGDDIRR
jgi:hypothetical protein